jgi:O-6-methylguanine DNA methyltransferase
LYRTIGTILLTEAFVKSKFRNACGAAGRYDDRMSSFRITGLDPEHFRHLFGKNDEELAALGARRFVVDASPGFPDRVEMRDHGTNFQLRVWNALLAMERGERTSYAQLAAAIGTPKAVRAVGNALAVNPVAILIPCHRVITSSGALGNYRWGEDRKRALLAWESAQR